MTEPRRQLMFGSEAIGFLDRPNYEIGDERYLRLDWPYPIQARPVVISDFVAGVIYDSGLTMLIKRYRPGSCLRVSIKLPQHLRRNTAANARRAWRRELRRSPGLAAAEQVLLEDARRWRESNTSSKI